MPLGFERWEDATLEQLYEAIMTYFDVVLKEAEELDFEIFSVSEDGAVTHKGTTTLNLMFVCLAVDVLRKHHQMSSASVAHALSDLGYKPCREAVLKLIDAYDGDGVESEFKVSRDRVFDVARLLSSAD
ncbi:MAG: hypothetical protein VX730_07995 [Pseudomonadota bacterium]|nr:hypothetical protein [Pseudomonadota bacterium]